MKKETTKIGLFAILSSVIWALTMLACALAFKGTEHYTDIQMILGGAAAGHLIFIWGPMGAMINKRVNKE